jgi:catechol 2,3-dioxygenase-like lactoylglutathione lyase family enzyme
MNLNQITLPSTNIETSIKFYEQLGLQLIVQALPNYARFECPEGDSTFSLHLTNKPRQQEGAWIYFEEEDLDNYINQLIRKGIAIQEMPKDKSWLWQETILTD